MPQFLLNLSGYKAGTYLIWKVGSIALSGVQNLFCTKLGSWDISKTIWAIRFQEFEKNDQSNIFKSDTATIYA